MSLSNAIVRQIIDEYDLTLEDLTSRFEDICWARGAVVQYKKVDGAEAKIAMSGDRAIITADPNGYYKTRIRFAVAHELGHFELHRNRRSSFVCDQKALNEWFSQQELAKLEVEANEFASEILLPEEFVRTDFTSASPSIQLLETVAEKYNVSLGATAKRFIDITPEPCALVFYNKNRILYHLRSKYFSEQGYWVTPGKLDEFSYAFDAANGKNVPKNMSSVDVTTWLSVREYLQEHSILEGTKFSTALNWGISLLWINDPKLIIR